MALSDASHNLKDALIAAYCLREWWCVSRGSKILERDAISGFLRYGHYYLSLKWNITQ